MILNDNCEIAPNMPSTVLVVIASILSSFCMHTTEVLTKTRTWNELGGSPYIHMKTE